MSDLQSMQKASNREYVLSSYKTAECKNRRNFVDKIPEASEHYIYPNQKEDAANVMDKFYRNSHIRIIGVPKKTKIGCDGFILETFRLACTHNDDNFIISPDNAHLITGMNNKDWEEQMKAKSPECIRDKIFHHGQLKHTNLNHISNGLVIIDEIDIGDKEGQVLDKTLRQTNFLELQNLIQRNNRVIIISATMIKQYHQLYQWGESHSTYKMTIPSEYIGHKEFLDKKIIQQSYSLRTEQNVEKWCQEDIINNYGNEDTRVHLVRSTFKNIKILEKVCKEKDIIFYNHYSDDRIPADKLQEIFSNKHTKHIVIAVKNYWRRANLIPNAWKLRIGAVHELYTAVDDSKEIQGFVGRMTGYWYSIIDNGHKTGPYRCNIESIKRYESCYNNPLGKTTSYQTSGFKKNNGEITVLESTIITPNVIQKALNVNRSSLIGQNSPASLPIFVLEEPTIQMKQILEDKDTLSLQKHCDKLMKAYPSVNNLYRSFRKRRWVVNTIDKYKKWSIDQMTNSSPSFELPILKGQKKLNEDCITIVIDNIQKRVIYFPWKGSKWVNPSSDSNEDSGDIASNAIAPVATSSDIASNAIAPVATSSATPVATSSATSGTIPI